MGVCLVTGGYCHYSGICVFGALYFFTTIVAYARLRVKGLNTTNISFPHRLKFAGVSSHNWNMRDSNAIICRNMLRLQSLTQKVCYICALASTLLYDNTNHEQQDFI